jgi:methionyl-tRNA formyltransferase
MGTPDFSIPSLEILINNRIEIKAVVTATDKPAGRGNKIMFSDVKNSALSHNLKILQPEKLKDINFISELKNLDADLFIVVAFRMLPKEIWNIPKIGTINLHAALLPNYRGAAPINHAIINGETKTGVSTFFIDENIDTGNLILQQECEIFPEDNFGTMYDKLKMIGAELVLQTVDLLSYNKIKTINQENLIHNNLHIAPKITKEFCKINWKQKAENIHNFIRGLSPSPCAFCYITENVSLKIFKSSFIIENHKLECGTVISNNKSFLKVVTLDGYVFIEELQISGKNKMSINAFLTGNKAFSNVY